MRFCNDIFSISKGHEECTDEKVYIFEYHDSHYALLLMQEGKSS
jgi:hypothetical protein